MTDLPPLALSVRQPWAWAIIHGGKDIENRSAGSIRAGRMDCRRIAIHAATAMRRKEYDWALWRMAQDGVTIPPARDLVRGGIIGAVDVVDIVEASDSPWFGGPCGLVLANPAPCTPIAATGTLGYFKWHPAGELRTPEKWMTTPDPDAGLFDALPPQFATPPAKPFGRKKTR